MYEEEKFEVGSTVVLKSGGPAMVVYDIEEETYPMPEEEDAVIIIRTNIKCHWLPEGGTSLAHITVPATSLELWDDIIE